jgi:hypothetical protein
MSKMEARARTHCECVCVPRSFTDHVFATAQFCSCEEDEQSECTRYRGTARYNQIPDERKL